MPERQPGPLDILNSIPGGSLATSILGGVGGGGGGGGIADVVTNPLQQAVGTMGGLAGLPFSTVANMFPAGAGGGQSGPIDTTGWSGGNGRYVTRTTVETMDTQDGTIVKVKRFAGTPYMMNEDVRKMKKVLRQAGALQKRIPRKTRKESAGEKLKSAVTETALATTRQLAIAGHNHD